MGNYFLVAFKNDASTQQAIKESPTVAHKTERSIQKFNRVPANMELTASDPLPVPQPITLEDGSLVGEFLGYHYDGSPTGTSYAPAPVVKPGYTVFTIVDMNLNRISSLQGKTLALMIETFMSNAENYKKQFLENFIEKIDNEEQWQLHDTLVPVFTNDTDKPAPLHILKTSTFQPGDDALLVKSGNRPCWVPDGYQSPRLASQMRYSAV